MSFIRNLFKGKKDKNHMDSNNFYNTQENENALNNSDLTNEQKVLNILINSVENSVLESNSLFVTDIKLKIEVHVPQATKNMAQVIFVLKHNLFNEEFIESSAGVGNTTDIALQQATISFCVSALCGITHALKNENGQNFESEFNKKTSKFKLYKSCISAQGEKKVQQNPIDYWEVINNEIKNRLGIKPVYWVKIYLSKTANSVNCECRINGIVSNNITKILNKIAEEWDIETALYSEKQFFVLIQDKETYTQYKFSKEQVVHCTLKALDLFKLCDTNEKYENLYYQFIKMCNDPSLACDLFNFVPEIFCKFIFPEAQYAENMTLCSSTENITLFKDKLTSYNWIYQTIDNEIRRGSFNNDEFRTIVNCSASFNAINKALNDGSKIEDLLMCPLSFSICEDYIIS